MITVPRVTALLAQAWEALGGDPDLVDLVDVTGDAEGLLPARLPALEAMVAAVGCATLAASTLDAARTGGAPGAVRLDRRHIAVAARSERHSRLVGSAGRDEAPGTADLFAPLSRFWRTADGWLRLHANYPWHRERALGVLRPTGEDVDAVGRAVGSWRATDLEEALVVGGGVAAAVRSQEEWRTHPAGAAATALPLVRRWTPPPPLHAVCNLHSAWGSGRGAAGARVLDLTRVIAGPVTTRTLAAWGADVLRVDPPHLPELPAQVPDTLVGKHSAVIDVRAPDGTAVLEDLLTEANVLVHGYRPGSLDRVGLSSAALAARHPHLTVVSISAWGDEGPWAGRRGFDSLVQAACGIAVSEGSLDAPGALPAQVLDHATGYLAAAAAMLSLAGTLRGEAPVHASLSLAATARWLMSEDPVRAPSTDATDRQADDYVATVSRTAGGGVSVIAPPGQVAGLPEPAWRRAAAYGGDPPEFPPRGPQPR